MQRMRLYVLAMLMFSCALINAVAVAEIYNEKDVVAFVSDDQVVLLDLNTGNDVVLQQAKGLLDVVWDKNGKNLYMLCSINIPGPKFDSPDRNEEQLYEINLPANTKVLLKKLTPPKKNGNEEYRYPSLDLDKKGNPVIILHYGYPDETYMRSTYDLSTKTLSTPVKITYDPEKDSYQRKTTFPALVETGKYENVDQGGVYNLRYIGKNGKFDYIFNYGDYPYTSFKPTKPIRYVVSPDSSFIVMSHFIPPSNEIEYIYLWSENTGVVTHLKDFHRFGGYGFVPFWLSNGNLAFLHEIGGYSGKKTILKLVSHNAVITELKEWEGNKKLDELHYRCK